MARRAVFLDRDGVLMRDVDLVVRLEQVEIYPYARAALAALREAGLALVVVTNQPVVARGLVREEDVDQVHAHIQEQLGGVIERFLFCPHHPSATVERYRAECQCRKPRPGMLERAAREMGLDLARSVMIGDRLSDVVAGRRAGCATVLVETGMHTAPAIQSPDPPTSAVPDHRCTDLAAAVAWILSRSASEP